MQYRLNFRYWLNNATQRKSLLALAQRTQHILTATSGQYLYEWEITALTKDLKVGKSLMNAMTRYRTHTVPLMHDSTSTGTCTGNN